LAFLVIFFLNVFLRIPNVSWRLEKTYFVLIEKLRDPYFARIILGIPAILILLISGASYFGIGWEIVGIIIGLVLLLRLLGIDELVAGFIRDFRFSFDRSGWIGYLGALAIFSIALFVGYQSFQRAGSLNISTEKIIPYVVENTAWIVFMGLFMIMIGKTIDALIEKKKYEVTKYTLYSAAGALTTLVIVVGCRWIVNMNEPYVDFGLFLTTIAAALLLGYLVTWLVNTYRRDLLIEMKIEGKEAITEHGAYLGRIAGVDGRRGKIIVQTMFEKKYSLPISAVVSVEDNVILKMND